MHRYYNVAKFTVLLCLTSGILAFAHTYVWGQMPTGDPAEEFGIRIARVKYGGGGDWYSDPSSLPNWLAEFEERTGIETQSEEKVVSLTDENLRAYPFLYMTGHGTVRLTREVGFDGDGSGRYRRALHI